MPTWTDDGYVTHAAIRQKPGKGHDRTLVTETFAGVADGATPLDPDWPDPGPLAERALHELSKFTSLEPDLQPEFAFASAIRATQLIASAGAGSTCAIAVAWLDAGHLTVGVLGDCLAIIEESSGGTIVLTDTTVDAFDDQVAAARQEDQPTLLRRHRALANTERGYWIYGSALEAANHVRWTRIPTAQVQTIFLCTDGLRRVSLLRAAFADQEIAGPSPIFLTDVMNSIPTRRLDGSPVDSLDDEAAVLIARPGS